jgi:hypothetical protein
MLKNMNQLSVKSMQRSFDRVKSGHSLEEKQGAAAQPHTISANIGQPLGPDNRVQANTSRMVRNAAARERDQLLKEQDLENKKLKVEAERRRKSAMRKARNDPLHRRG